MALWVPTFEMFLADNWRVVTAAEAELFGFDRNAIARLRRTAEWQREMRGVYSVQPCLEPQAVVRSRAALKYAGVGAAIGRRTRLALLAPDPIPDLSADVDVATTRSRHVRSTTGVRIQQLSSFGVEVDPRWPQLPLIPAPSAAVHAWCDPSLTRYEREDAICRAVATHRISGRDIIAASEEFHRVTARDQLIATCAGADLGCESASELRYLFRVERAFGLPTPRRQVKLRSRGGVALRVDVLYDGVRLVVEIDGRQHRGEKASAEDDQRDAALARMGYTVIRVPAWRIEHEPALVAAEIRAELTRLGARV
jgi:very-short-patch-repair endonuclease